MTDMTFDQTGRSLGFGTASGILVAADGKLTRSPGKCSAWTWAMWLLAYDVTRRAGVSAVAGSVPEYRQSRGVPGFLARGTPVIALAIGDARLRYRGKGSTAASRW